MAPKVHAPDGGIFGHPACEARSGDTTITDLRAITCSDCLDIIETVALADDAAEADVFARLAAKVTR